MDKRGMVFLGRHGMQLGQPLVWIAYSGLEYEVRLGLCNYVGLIDPTFRGAGGAD
jgi:hypothetical protein